MASIESDILVRLYIFGLPRQEGIARIRTRDAGERRARALRAVGVCVLLSAFSILLPIAHFVLVPGFLIAASVVGVRRLREHASIVGLSGVCPRCLEPRRFAVKEAFGDAVSTSCEKCSFAIDVETS